MGCIGSELEMKLDGSDYWVCCRRRDLGRREKEREEKETRRARFLSLSSRFLLLSQIAELTL